MNQEEIIRVLDQPELLQAVFYPRREVKRTPPDAVDFDIPTRDDVSLGARWYMRDEKLPSVLYFHGNGETVSDHDDIAPLYHEIGLNLFVVDYRGYGWSGGSPSFHALLHDTPKVADFFLERVAGTGDGPAPLLMGRSLGSAPACALASSGEHAGRFAGLILESGFSDVVALLRLFGIGLSSGEGAVSELFSNHLKLRRIELPVLLLHGELDRLIPPHSARENFENIAHENKTLRVLPGVGHNDILMRREDYFRAIREFADG